MQTPTSGSPEQSPARSVAFMEHALNTWGATVFRVALNQMRTRQDAEDVTQDVFLRLLNDETRFHDDEHLKAWLLRVTVNRCRELHRSAWRRHERTSSDGAAETILGAREHAFMPGAAAACEAEALAEPSIEELHTSAVWTAVQNLPPALRLVVHLHCFEGYPTDEIARFLRCRPATVRTRLHRARKRIEAELGSDG